MTLVYSGRSCSPLNGSFSCAGFSGGVGVVVGVGAAGGVVVGGVVVGVVATGSGAAGTPAGSTGVFSLLGSGPGVGAGGMISWVGTLEGGAALAGCGVSVPGNETRPECY